MVWGVWEILPVEAWSPAPHPHVEQSLKGEQWA